MDKIQNMSKRRDDAHAELMKLNSRVYKAFLQLEAATFSDGELTKQVKELIAVGI